MCKVSRGSEDHLVQGLADFGSFSQKMPLKWIRFDNYEKNLLNSDNMMTKINIG